MPLNKIVYLANRKTDTEGFKKKRNAGPRDTEDEKPKTVHPKSQDRMRAAYIRYNESLDERETNRTIEANDTVELIQINFYVVFSRDLVKKFYERYGLGVLEYTDFNRTVLFEVLDYKLFNNFQKHVKLFYEVRQGSTYEGMEFNLIALIHEYRLLTTKLRIQSLTEGAQTITLISSSNPLVIRQRKRLVSYLEKTEQSFTYDPRVEEIITISSSTVDIVQTLAANFDVIRLITSARSIRVRPGVYQDVRREFGFELTVPDDLTVVGLIDSGLNRLDPIREVITSISYDHSGYGPYWDESGHGTLVGGLIVVGDEFLTDVRGEYEAKARLAVIKAIHEDTDYINIPRLINDIRDAKRQHGIRIFNMSLNMPTAKKYNDHFSSFAYELDRLAYEEDLMIIMSVGNTSEDRLRELIEDSPHVSHDYPKFFYCPLEPSDIHSCQTTNLYEPSESMNNLSIGALAGNLEGGLTDITPTEEYPAYYTRKFHLDYTQKVNGSLLKKNQMNKHLNKPDLIYEGGDMFNPSAGIEILRSPLDEVERFYGRASGTSLSTPLVTSLACELLNSYPTLRVQTVKALLINAATLPCGERPPHFQGLPFLLRKLAGYGKPVRNQLCFNEDNRVTFVIEDVIAFDEVITIPIELPKYISQGKNKLNFTITLCYNFMPIKDNHLSYLPLHISFGVFKPYNADIISSHDNKDTIIKSGISWSEDFFGVENRLFSNVQKLSFNLQPHDLDPIDHKVSFAVRCTGKQEIDETYRAYVKDSNHRFSVAISITELTKNVAEDQLYNTMTTINTVRSIVEGEAQAEI